MDPSALPPAQPGPDLAQSPVPLPPVAIGHGVYDRVIPVELGRRARQRLEEAGADVLYRESAMPHSVDPGFLRELRTWLRSAVEHAAAGRS